MILLNVRIPMYLSLTYFLSSVDRERVWEDGRKEGEREGKRDVEGRERAGRG